jgi:hypothetical protein
VNTTRLHNCSALGGPEPRGTLLVPTLTQLHVLVISEHEDDIRPDIPAVPLESAFQAVVGQEGRAPAQQGEEGSRQQPAWQARGRHPRLWLAPASLGRRRLQLCFVGGLLPFLLPYSGPEENENQVSVALGSHLAQWSPCVAAPCTRVSLHKGAAPGHTWGWICNRLSGQTSGEASVTTPPSLGCWMYGDSLALKMNLILQQNTES